jgi:8-oxo-dGTP diphosphatase
MILRLSADVDSMHLIRTLNSRPVQMSTQREIVKIGLAVTDDSRLLLVRKKGGESYILPGGKPELGEDDRQALVREIEEELGCGVDASSIYFLGSFSDVAADLQDTIVTVRLYSAKLTGLPSPQSEIEQLKWFRPDSETDVTLAPSLQNYIVPFLCSHGHL